MKGIIIANLEEEKKVSKVSANIQKFLISPSKSGLVGFIAFFLVLTMSKYLGFLVGALDKFRIETQDLFLSLLGFALVYIIKMLENFKEKAEAS